MSFEIDPTAPESIVRRDFLRRLAAGSLAAMAASLASDERLYFIKADLNSASSARSMVEQMICSASLARHESSGSAA